MDNAKEEEEIPETNVRVSREVFTENGIDEV